MVLKGKLRIYGILSTFVILCHIESQRRSHGVVARHITPAFSFQRRHATGRERRISFKRSFSHPKLPHRSCLVQVLKPVDHETENDIDDGIDSNVNGGVRQQSNVPDDIGNNHYVQPITLPHFLTEESLILLNEKLNSYTTGVVESAPSKTVIYPLLQQKEADEIFKSDNGYPLQIEIKNKDNAEEIETTIRSDDVGPRNGIQHDENKNINQTSFATEAISNSKDVGKASKAEKSESNTGSPVTLRSLWRRRSARSAEEGIRREKTTTTLSDVMDKARGSMMEIQNRRINASRKFAARTITGFINALAEDVAGLEVHVNSNPKTPLWSKHVEDITIQFARLGFKPLQISGGVFEPSQVAHHYQARSLLGIYDDFVTSRMKKNVKADPRVGSTSSAIASTSTSESAIRGTVCEVNATNDINDKLLSQLYGEQDYNCPTADEAFDRIDVDNSGSLDRDELIQALNLAATASFEDVDDDNKAIIEDLANDLVELYDMNGDGVVDRKEYKSMVADMAELRRKQYQDDLNEKQETEETQRIETNNTQDANPILGAISNAWNWIIHRGNSAPEAAITESIIHQRKSVQVIDSPELVESVAKTLGSITISDIKLDLRRLLFGAIPFINRITPGGPLVLEPFTVTVNGSFNRHDIMNSFLLDAALRRLVTRVLRVRIGFIRDFIEGSVFYGRSWRMFGEGGPKVEVPQLTEIEFDENNKLIITGRAKVQTSPTSPVVEQAFKVRTRIGTRQNGRFVRLEEPELALVLECPKSWESNLNMVSDALNIKRPLRPKPLYSFFPIYSPFKLNDDGGFDLGEDNKIRSLYIQNGALCFEMTSVLRPGRFLGSHYIAFSVPNRTFIVTLDRVKEGIKAARKTKKAAQALLKQASSRRRTRRRRRQNLSDEETTGGNLQTKPAQQPKVRGFFGRFVDGYLQAEREEAKKERITVAIRDFFGRQGGELPSSEVR